MGLEYYECSQRHICMSVDEVTTIDNQSWKYELRAYMVEDFYHTQHGFSLMPNQKGYLHQVG